MIERKKFYKADDGTAGTAAAATQEAAATQDGTAIAAGQEAAAAQAETATAESKSAAASQAAGKSVATSQITGESETNDQQPKGGAPFEAAEGEAYAEVEAAGSGGNAAVSEVESAEAEDAETDNEGSSPIISFTATGGIKYDSSVMEQDNDVYHGDLLMLKKDTVDWTESHKAWKFYRTLLIIATVGGLALVLFVLYKMGAQRDMDSKQLPLHISIWVTFLAMYIVGSKSSKLCKPPFNSLHNVRIEMSDTGIYYVYQRKMKEYIYYIKDENIEEMIYDSERRAMYIKGKARIKHVSRSGDITSWDTDEMYMMMPFDRFDIDDMFEPYGDRVKFEPGTLREKFSKEGFYRRPPV